uniref:Mitochondrial import inner membrane translocase subunit TIM44 n=1 Tax=Oncorhynchus tshawytscha TaxID=74940 RepID=A0AAZ3PDW3_ONCTS
HVYRICGSLTSSSQVRYASDRGGGRKSFFGGFLDNLKQELSKNKEMKENIKKFREEAKKLEESEALNQAWRKYVNTKKLNSFIPLYLGQNLWPGKYIEGLEEVSRTDIGKKIKEGMEEAESVSKSGGKLGKTGAFRAISQVRSVKKEIDDLNQSGAEKNENKVFEANEYEFTPVILKRWTAEWEQYGLVQARFFEMKYDESKDVLIRASRAVTDKMTDVLGGLFSKTEMSEVLTEILKVDPLFDKDVFLKQCEFDITPNVLEVKKDISSDIGVVQMVMKDKVLRMMYVWALCRDQEELNTYAAWRLLDISASSTDPLIGTHTRLEDRGGEGRQAGQGNMELPQGHEQAVLALSATQQSPPLTWLWVARCGLPRLAALHGPDWWCSQTRIQETQTGWTCIPTRMTVAAVDHSRSVWLCHTMV